MTNTLERIPVQPPVPTLPTPPPARRRWFDLSATQLVATGLAATTATVAASYLGVAGTVIGAALASVLTAIGNAVYTHSLRRTRERVRGVLPAARRGTQPPLVDPPVSGAAPTVIWAEPAARRPPEPLPSRPGSRDARIWRRVALGSIAVFVAVLALLTSVELIAGRPLSDLVRGDSGHGTSLFGDQPAGSTTPAPQPTSPTTVTQTVTPNVQVVTPTVTQTAPAVTHTSTPTVTATPTPTATPTQPSASAAATTAPAATGAPSG
ncbi:MAG TPA: hypothetical protein VFU35_09665 [Jatrophihabitans sp.]|nr:hypothetical protein [Jatrophihabitans sp.]